MIIYIFLVLVSNINVPIYEVVFFSIYIFSIIPGLFWILEYNARNNLIKKTKTDYLVYILIIFVLLILPILSIFYYINLFIDKK